MEKVLNDHAAQTLEWLDKMTEGFSVDTTACKRSLSNKITDDMTHSQIRDVLVKTTLEQMDESETDWTFIAARAYIEGIYQSAADNRGYHTDDRYGDFQTLLQLLTDEGIYTPALIEKYTSDDIAVFGAAIEPERDYLFNYLGLYTMATRYLATDHDRRTFELPQERWMVIAMHLMQDEPREKRQELVLEAYWALSHLYMTVATPTMNNAGKTHGQLSSCFIDTVDDSLQSIYDTNTDIARLSKNGGGIGVYMGKVRALGSAIKGFEGMSSGVVPWIKQLNNTAVSVDQLGTRKGAIAVYLDVWHKDIEAFLDLKLNNGDERMRAHDIFTGVTLPDLFMEKVEAREDWHLFDPHEVRQVMGFSLEDFYDETKGDGSFRQRYEACVANDKLSRKTISAIDLIKRILKSQLESGTPFMFYRDEVNRKNNNPHEGMIYCSNLCTEITQNQSATQLVAENTDDNGMIVKQYQSGDYVVCNLSSINLGRTVPEDVLDRLIKIQVRMLDNVIDINTLPIKQATMTNHKYRAIGLGTFGWHHLLAKEHIQWESQEAVDYADQLYERIAYLTIQNSMELAREKGSYPAFSGSRWDDGSYFSIRNYTSDAWNQLQKDVQTYGIRNGYLMAVAPNSSTSMIAGSTASIDPVFKPFYYEEKKDFKIPNAAPELDHHTYDIYRRSAYIVDQRWSVSQNAARQKHVDQSISFNFYVPYNIKASVLLDLHLRSWREGLKTTYYVRSTANDIEDCEWCES